MIDVESLLKPIRDDAPSGHDLRLIPGDQTLDRIKGARTALDPERDPDGKGREPNWPEVLKLCEDALRGQTKDLELFAWIVEAAARVDGFAGLEQGLDGLARGMASFWETIYPGVDEDGISLAIRARPLSWLGSSSDFLRSVKGIPIAPGAEGGLSWADYENAQHLDDPTLSAERRSELSALGFISGEQWELGLSGLTADSLRAHTENLASCQGKVESIERFCAERFDDEELPNLHPLRSHLGEVREYLEARLRQLDGAAPIGTASQQPAAGAATAAAAPSAAGPIQTRQEALRQLREIAEYFRKIEPHSPISYLLLRAVRWGDLPLEELLVDLTRNDNVLAHIRETLGLDAGSEKKKG